MAGRLKAYAAGFDRQLWLLFLAEIIGSTGRAIAWPFFSLYLYNQVGIPMTLIGAGMALSSAVGIPSQFLAGALTDHFGRRPVILVGIAATALMVFSVIFVSSFEQYILLSLGMGVATSLQPTASRAMVADITPRSRLAQGYGLLYIATNVGFSLGPALGGFIASVGYQYIFGAAAGIELVVLAVFLALLRETYTRTTSDARPSGVRATMRGMRRVFSDRPFMLYCAATAAVGAVYDLLFTVLPVYAKNFVGVSEVGIGVLWMLNASMVLVLQLPIARLVERRSRGRTLFAGTLFYAAGFAGFALAGDFTALLAFTAIITLGENIITPASAALVAEKAPPDMRGRYMAFQGIAWSLGYGIGPLAGGLLLDHALGLLWPLAGLTCLAAAFGYLLVGRLYRPDLTHPP